MNSSTRGPSSVTISPAKRQPTNGVPRRASSSSTGWWIASTSASASPSQPTGENAPIPPVFGPVSPSPIRLKSCAAPSATARRPSQSAKTDASRPSSSSSTTTGPPSAAAARRPSSSSAAVRQTKTPFPAASPSAFTTHGARGSSSVAAIGTPAEAITSFANVFEPSIRAAAALGPKTATPA